MQVPSLYKTVPLAQSLYWHLEVVLFKKLLAMHVVQFVLFIHDEQFVEQATQAFEVVFL